MKKILVKNARLIAPGARLHLQRADVLVENGVISHIGSIDAAEGAQVVQGNNLHLSPGWFDLRVNFCDPGFEYREDLDSGCEAAAYGGFSGVGLMPETEPNINSKSLVEYIKVRTVAKPVAVHPLAAVSRDNDFKELSEMYELAGAGAAAFSTGTRSTTDSGFLLRSLMYSRTLGRAVMLHPDDKSISGKGQMNEGVVNVQLGLKGMPALAEEVEVANGIGMAKYAGSRVHFSGVSTARSLQLIDEAVGEGLAVTADVSIHHLQFAEEDLLGFDTNLKLRPPLRTPADRDALRKAVLEKEYLSITSAHMPYEDDRKKCEFELAAYGAIGTQTCFSQLRSIFSEEKDWVNALAALVTRPRKVLGIEVPVMQEGVAANLTIFDPEAEWMLDESTNKSKSRNSPVWKTKLRGKAIAVINKGTIKILS